MRRDSAPARSLSLSNYWAFFFSSSWDTVPFCSCSSLVARFICIYFPSLSLFACDFLFFLPRFLPLFFFFSLWQSTSLQKSIVIINTIESAQPTFVSVLSAQKGRENSTFLERAQNIYFNTQRMRQHVVLRPFCDVSYVHFYVV